MIDLSKLNVEQKKAVTDTEGPVLVFAGAGSGKTRVLTYRIAYLIEEKKVSPWNILAITFTNKATNEMKERLGQMLTDSSVWVSTFHSLCVKILYRFAEKIGYTSSFSIYDESATGRLLTKILREKHLEEDKEKNKYSYHIGIAKNAGMNPDQYFNHIRATEKDALTISEVYERYDDLLRENNAMDFDDLLIKCYKLLAENDDVCDYYSEKFRYIHVDEFQDTNGIQFDILKLLGRKWRNVFVVGDDDQSIYGWRGADVRNILDFNKFFLDAKIHKLEQNYRSTQFILNCANNLIQNNSARSPKHLFTEGTQGDKVEFCLYGSDYEEVDNVINKIRRLKCNYGYKNKDIAILVRNNAITRIFETSLNKQGMKYRLYGGYKFFDRKEILDVLAYLRILVNPFDSDAIVRVINFPKRNIGDTTVEQLMEYAEKENMTLFDVVMDIDNTSFGSSVKSKVGVFRDLIGELKMQQSKMNLSEFCQYLVKIVGFELAYRVSGKEEDENRWANIEEFLTYVDENYNENSTVEEFLHTVMLNVEKANDDGDDDCLVLATMHSVKGLEFPIVFIVACEEGIIPSSQSLREATGVDEERRVMYVAITRAQERLYISAVKGYRRKYNRMEAAMPSRFMSEANGAPIIPPQRENPWQKQSYSGYLSYRDREDDCPVYPMQQKTAVKPIPKPQIQVTNTSVPKPPVQKDVSGFKAGAKVRHSKFGIGTVLMMQGEGNSATVTVAFKDLGVKKFSLMVAPLEIV